MAITFGNSGYDTSGASFSYNNNGDTLIVTSNATSAGLSDVKFDGVSMTKIGTTQYDSVYSRYYDVWVLSNPSQGSKTLSWTGSSNTYFGLSSVSGVDQTTPYTGLTSVTQQTGANPSISVTTTVNNAYVMCCALIQNTPTAGANTTLVQTVTGAASYIFRSTNTVTPAGSFTINTTASSGDYTFKAFGLNPPYVPNTSNFLAFM